MEGFTGIKRLDDVLNRHASARSREESENTLGELTQLAPCYIPEIRRLFDSNTYYRMPLVWCLIGQKSPDAVELFTMAIGDKNKYTRWAAAEALAKCSKADASPQLVKALKDRSHFVKGTAIDAMMRFRDPAAIPQLKKIIASRQLRQQVPGLVECARRALKRCENAS